MATELITTQTVGSNTTFGPFSIEYIDIADIKVSLNGTLQTLTTHYTIDANTSVVTFVTAPSVNDVIRIFRETPVDQAKAVYAAGSSIRAQNLNDNVDQALFAIQELRDQFVTESGGEFLTDVDFNDNRLTNVADPTDPQDAVTKQYLEDNYFDDGPETILSSEAWTFNDTTIASTEAIEDRITEKIDEAITGDIAADSTGITVTDDGDGTITLGLAANSIDLDRIKSADIIASGETNPNDDDTIATTAKIDDMIDEAITNDIAVDGTGLTVTDDGDGTITLGIGAGSIDLDRIKSDDIITYAEQNAGPTVDDDTVFTSSAAARRFDTLVQTATPTGTDWQVGKTWLQNDDDLTVSVWNGSGWTAVSSGGTFREQANVVYVDPTGDNASTGHRISAPKQTIKAAIDQINEEIDITLTSGGSGYVEGTYNGVALTGGTGTGLQADITVNASGTVTTVTLVSTTPLIDTYYIGDVLSASNTDLGGTGSGLEITVEGDGDGQIVVVSAGVYQEIAPIQIKRRNVSIIGQALRSCLVHPTVATQTNVLFELNSGSYLTQLTLTGVKAGNSGTNTLDADLPSDQGWNFAFYNDAYITKSPYIQNCTNFSDSQINNADLNAHNPAGGIAGDLTSAPTGGGLLVNGATPADNSPLRSMVCDSYTHVGLNGPGILATNNGYVQATSSYAFFNKYHIKCLNGGQANLAASTTDFGEKALVADGKSPSTIFSAALSSNATAGDITFTIDAPTANVWFGSATRPQGNMLVTIGGNTYPILSATANGTGWDVTISNPNTANRSVNDGLIADVTTPATVDFYLRSMIASSGHTMEYVGSGTNYTALPENGGVPVDANQKVELNNGKIWTATTDQNGKFTIGGNQTDAPFFEVDQQLGFVTIPEGSIAFNLRSDQSPQLGADLDVNTNTITGLPSAPTGATEATSKAYVDAQVAAATSDVVDDTTPQLGGNLDVNGNTITSTSNGDIVIDPDGTGSIKVGSAITTDTNANLSLSPTGTGHVTVNSNQIRDVADPTAAQDAATKNYVDTATAGISSDKITEGDTEAEVVDNGGDGHFKVTTEGDERLRVNSSGDVGIGTATPTARLHIQASNPSVQLQDSDATNLYSIITNAGGDSIYEANNNATNGQHIFKGTSSNEMLRIGSAGQIGIAGANYGTSGQVLTSGGASGAISWADAASGGGATGGGTDKVFQENLLTVDTDYTIGTNIGGSPSIGSGASCVGPITVASGVTLTVPANARLVVL